MSWGAVSGWVHEVSLGLLWYSYSGLLGSPPPSLDQLFGSLALGGRRFGKGLRNYAASKFANLDVPSSVQSLFHSLLLPSSGS